MALDAVDCEGNPVHIEVKSGADGSYHLEDVPCGKWTVNIDKGSFHRDFSFTFEPGEVHDVTGAANKLCFQATAVEIAVLQGNWDHMEQLLDDLGLAYDYYTTEDIGEAGTIYDLLNNPTAMAKYKIIFANCGGYHGWMPQDFPEVMDNVTQWVLAGGSLYMSDYAWVYGEHSFPDAIEFYGEDDPKKMYTPDSPQWVSSGNESNAMILDGALAAYLGKTSVKIVFDQGPQIAPMAGGPGTFVHAHGTIFQPFGDKAITEPMPMILSYVPAEGAGRVIYTNFHNDAQATADILKILNYLVFTL